MVIHIVYADVEHYKEKLTHGINITILSKCLHLYLILDHTKHPMQDKLWTSSLASIINFCCFVSLRDKNSLQSLLSHYDKCSLCPLPWLQGRTDTGL